MRIFRSIIAIAIALFLISNMDRESDNRLAASPEEAILISDHSSCEAIIAAREEENQFLRHQLEEARRSFDLILRIELNFVPGLFGSNASVSFRSAAIRVSAAAAEGLRAGDDLSSAMINSSAILEQFVDCRIIIESISESA